VIFRQIIHDDLGCASYLIGDDEEGVAAVVDPRFEIDEYLELARYMGVSIEHVLETHNHADHVSGHGRLAAATGAAIHIHREADVGYAHEPLDDGDELALGSVTVRALHTPGHRPEHTAFALIETARAAEPWGVLTGDTLFVGDVARPDLAIEKSAGARAIFHSLHEKLLTMAPEVEIWPGHLGGSMCGGPGMDMKVSSTIGFEREHNPTLAIRDEDEFVDQALAKLGPQPPNFEAVVALNQGPLLTGGAEQLPLAPRQVEQKRTGGRCWSTFGPISSSTKPTSPRRSATRSCRRALAPSSHGSPIWSRRSCSSAATTRTAGGPGGSRSPSASASWAATCTGA